jgi:hypothetical protein
MSSVEQMSIDPSFLSPFSRLVMVIATATSGIDRTVHTQMKAFHTKAEETMHLGTLCCKKIMQNCAHPWVATVQTCKLPGFGRFRDCQLDRVARTILT